MSNDDIKAAWYFHNGTKHPNGYLLSRTHRFNPAQKPRLFKTYTDLKPIPLPLDVTQREMSALEAISNPAATTEDEQIPDFGSIARILHFSAGITKRFRYPEPYGEIPFRAAACTGALYHIELYLICGDLPDLDAGVYHYDSQNSGLIQLREGDYVHHLTQASGMEDAISHAPAIIAYTHISWRNACKYQARAYRHAFWDSGTILSHTLALANAERLRAKVVIGFVDEAVSELLGLDEEKELPLVLLSLGYGPEPSVDSGAALDALDLAVEPIAQRETIFPAIREMHTASSLWDRSKVKQWRKARVHVARTKPGNGLVASQPLGAEQAPTQAVEKVILRRGSSRKFSHDPISFNQLSTLLVHALRPIPFDVTSADNGPLTQAYIVVNNVKGLASGKYAYHHDHEGFERLEAGVFRAQAGKLALDQNLGADASVNIYFLTGLRSALEDLGNRGYRFAQLEASISAGRIYLGAYALGLGATGLTFYDDEVTKFFSPHAAEKSVMFLVAVGVPAGDKH